jgi:hypothetical protein
MKKKDFFPSSELLKRKLWYRLRKRTGGIVLKDPKD